VPSGILRPLVWGVCAVLLCLPGVVSAITIGFDLQALGGDHYRYTYTVTNDGSLGAGVALELFDILFPPDRYDESSLTIVTPPALQTAWSELILASAPGVPAAYDVAALSGGLPDGARVTGFAVAFQWLGTGSPGAQAFEVFDAQFNLLESGTTLPAPPTAIPEPGALALVGTGLVRLLWKRRRAQHLPNEPTSGASRHADAPHD
jgi:hypothetical protein